MPAVRPLRPANKVFIPLFVVAVALLAWMTQKKGPTTVDNPPPGVERAEAPNRGKKADFDFYLLALTAHPAFCADGHAREPECRSGRVVPISIHGLWPERVEPGKYPRDCEGPPLDLSEDTERSLASLMPGMADGLHHHEWRKHGTCTGLDDDQYFQATFVRAVVISQALESKLTTVAGGLTDAAALRAKADELEAGLGATLTFHCKTLRDAPREFRHQSYLIEVRQCMGIARDGAPGRALKCATVNRRDQGCGARFRIAAPRS